MIYSRPLYLLGFIVRYIFFLFVLVFFSSAASAVVDLYEFDSDSQRQRYQTFVEELRCPKCQNQNLSGSNSPIASDLRREVHRLLTSGATDDEVVEFMVERYGEYVLYKPRARGATLLLWLAPGALLLFGLVILGWILHRRARPVVQGKVDDSEGIALSSSQRERLAALLKADSNDIKGDK